MARFQISDGARSLAIERSPFIVGRAPSCQLRIDAPEVAPRHALFRIDGNDLYVHDMAGGTQTTRVNGEPLEGEARLASDDIVSIGGHTFTVEIRPHEQVVTSTDATAARTLEAEVPDDPAALRLAMLRRAMAVASGAQAITLMTTQLERFASVFGTVSIPMEEMALYTEMAIRLLAETGNARWLDQVFDAHRALGRPIPGDSVDALFALAAERKFQQSPALDAYVQALREGSERLSPAERFVLQRLTGLRDRLRS